MSPPGSPLRTQDAVKRGLDLAAASLGLMLTAPLQLVVAGLVRRDVGSPVLFRQERPGRDGRLFTLYKFRTMRAPLPGAPQGDEDRLTRFGALLRSSSLDELPSLWNVLRGDLSLVGPRPLLVSYLERYDDVQRRRHEVRPGLTGLAQVAGRNQVDWTERLALDVRYVDERSLGLDARILLRSVAMVLRRQGISDGRSATMTEFLGNAER